MAAKGIKTSCICPVCDEEPENLSHALISCNFALSVWSLWQDCPIEKLLNVKEFNDLVLHFCSPLLDKHLDFFFAMPGQFGTTGIRSFMMKVVCPLV